MGPKQIRKNFQVIADCARHPRCSDRFEFSSGSERNQGQTIRSNRVVWSITSIFGNFTKFTRSWKNHYSCKFSILWHFTLLSWLIGCALFSNVQYDLAHAPSVTILYLLYFIYWQLHVDIFWILNKLCSSHQTLLYYFNDCDYIGNNPLNFYL